MKQFTWAFTSNSERNRAKLYKLSYMAFMLYLGYANKYRVKTWDLWTYERCREELYRQHYSDKNLYLVQNKKRRYFPKEIDIKNPIQNSVNFAYFVLKQRYKKIISDYLP